MNGSVGQSAESIASNRSGSVVAEPPVFLSDRVRAVFNAIADGVIVADEHGNLLDWNPAALRLLGFDNAADVRQPLANFSSLFEVRLPSGGPSLPLDQWPLAMALRREDVSDCVRSVTRVDTGHHWVISYSAAWICSSQAADGRSDLVVLTLRDLTPQYKAAEAMRASEARFRRLANAVPQIVWSIAPDGRVTYLNEGWGKCTGLSGAAPDDVARVIHPDDVIPTRRARERALRTGTPYEVEFRLRHVSGGPYRWFLGRGVPVTDEGGRIIEWFGTSTDIEDVKQADASSRENEARLRGVLESAVEGIVTIDETGTIQTVNPAVVRTFGYAREEMIGQNVRMLMPDPYAAEHGGYLRRYLATGRRKIIGIGREVVGRRKDGSTFPVDLSVSEVWVGDRRIFTGIIRDITQRKTMEDQARERQTQVAHLERVSTIGHMATGLAHELNQPLGAIANYAKASRSMVEGGRGTPAQVADMLSEIQSQAMRAGEIIHRLRAFVKKQQPKARPTDVNELVEETLRLLAFELRASGARVVLRLADDLPRVLADRVQIGQVLVNLIRNAQDAMPHLAGELTITTARSADDPSTVALAVCDNGAGVSPENLPRLFDAFFTTKPNGLGVGLALCRTIAEDHGGRLTATPNASGAGMTFQFTLRAAPSSTHPAFGVQR